MNNAQIKKQARIASWNRAIAEGRVVNFGSVGQLTSFSSQADALDELRRAREDGIDDAFIVPAELAEGVER